MGSILSTNEPSDKPGTIHGLMLNPQSFGRMLTNRLYAGFIFAARQKWTTSALDR